MTALRAGYGRRAVACDSRCVGAAPGVAGKATADLAIGETILVPRNSQLYGTIVEVQKGGRLARQGKLVVELKDIMIDGQLHVIVTGTYEAAGERQRTVGKTATGAVIGGAVDDEDGAKIGGGCRPWSVRRYRGQAGKHHCGDYPRFHPDRQYGPSGRSIRFVADP